MLGGDGQRKVVIIILEPRVLPRVGLRLGTVGLRHMKKLCAK